MGWCDNLYVWHTDMKWSYNNFLIVKFRVKGQIISCCPHVFHLQFIYVCQTYKLSHQPIQHYSPNRTYPMKHEKNIFLQVLTKSCCQLEIFVITDYKKYLMIKKYLLSIKGMGKWWWKVDKIRFQIYTYSIRPSIII